VEDRGSSLTEPICQSPEHGTACGDGGVVVGFQLATETAFYIVGATAKTKRLHLPPDGNLQAGVNQQEIY